MKASRISLQIVCLFFLCCLSTSSLKAQAPRPVMSITVEGAITPATASFIKESIDKAAYNKVSCLIIRLNTPGGLLKSTRDIVSDLLSSPVPIVVYVSPGGAHAGSAGVFITMAAHWAAMTPGTNIGAAHPVSSQGQMDSISNEKATNDAAAFIRSIAKERNRNLDWAEQAVRQSVSITAAEALDNNVIDYIAESESALLSWLNGKQVTIAGTTHTLQTERAPIIHVTMSFWEKMLHILTDPTVAYILLMAGMYGIMFELYSPGTMVPGIAGVICLILALYGMHTLPTNYAGLALIIFAIILFILEIKITSYGLLSIAGIICLFLGSVMLFKGSSALEFVRISRSILYSTIGFSALFFAGIAYMGLRAQKNRISMGREGMKGGIAEARSPLTPTGIVFFEGEIWNAISNNQHIEPGEKVTIKEMKNLILYVDKLNTNTQS